jgi:uncharacterized membrane protein
MILLPIHIVAGLIAIGSGFTAAFVVKGMKVHRKSGMIFVYSMLTLSLTGAAIATIRSQPANIIGGLISFYLVITGFLTVRARTEGFPWIDSAVMLLGILVAFLSINLGLTVHHSPAGKINGVPSAPLFVFGAVGIMAVGGDLRMMLMHGLHGKHRIARHLWRMCFALFIASGSFFLGQAKVFPKPIRIFPLLAIPAFLPLLILVYWMGRVLLTRWYRRASHSFKRAGELQLNTTGRGFGRSGRGLRAKALLRGRGKPN